MTPSPSIEFVEPAAPRATIAWTKVAVAAALAVPALVALVSWVYYG